MKVFISWSGEKSQAVALALREWLPLVINDIEPFVSDEDIHAGTRWQTEIARQLEATDFGILCITRDNQDAPWLNFEAGALAKAVETSRVVPLAIDLKPTDVLLPLGQLHAQPATQQGLRKVIASLNSARDQPLDETRIRKSSDKWWSDLHEKLEKIRKSDTQSSEGDGDSRSTRAMVEELLDTVRSLARHAGEGESSPAPGIIPLDPEHPVLRQLQEMVDPVDSEALIIPSGARGARLVGIFARKKLSDELWDGVQARAALYGVRVVQGPNRLRHQDQQSGSEIHH